ncbi:MAG: hypothetical protein F6K14_18760 [Symploca sp. SIO2C1]|nr:hypothetical protein [Symploca sp. SIO2C1]
MSRFVVAIASKFVGAGSPNIFLRSDNLTKPAPASGSDDPDSTGAGL